VYRSNPLSAASVRCFIRKPSDALLNLSSTPVENGELNQSLLNDVLSDHSARVGVFVKAFQSSVADRPDHL